MTEDKKWCVYHHIFPNGMRYIGITNDINRRWREGFGYQTQPKVFSQIVRYGWINIKHLILFDNLSQEEAKAKESALIAEAVKSGKQLLNTSETVLYLPNGVTAIENLIANVDNIRCFAEQYIGDDWVVAYSESGMHHGVFWYGDRVELWLLPELHQNKMVQTILTFLYPKSVDRITLRQLKEWLYSKPSPSWEEVKVLGDVPASMLNN